MQEEQQYYHAYELRYQQVHRQGLQWTSDTPTPIVRQTIEQYQISQQAQILEIGCGEGRDAAPLLREGRNLLATDVSPESIRYCREKLPAYSERFAVVDCLHDRLDCKFDFIYAVAVLHMLVLDEDRAGFYRFIREHLKPEGLALICTMGDGQVQMQSDITTAFSLQPRCYQQTGQELMLAGTSCRMVNFLTFSREWKQGGLVQVESGLSAAPPEFSSLMYAVVKCAENS